VSEPITLTLYGKAGCHLCDEARARLESLIGKPFDLEILEVDIESSDDLHQRYLERIPVLEHNGTVLSELGASQAQLVKLIAGVASIAPDANGN
jgi:flavoprotein